MMNVRQKADLFARSLAGQSPGSPSDEPALAPQLELARRLQSVPPPELSPAALAAGTVRVRETLGKKRGAGRPRWVFRAAWAALALVLALVVTTAGTVLAAEDSLPGQPLYPVKRAGEGVRLALAWSPEAHAALQVSFAGRRLEEVAAVCAVADCPADLLADLDGQTQGAQDEIERLPAEKQAALLEKMVALTVRQQEVLAQVLATAPDSARPGLERALERSQRGHERAQQALEKDKEKKEKVSPSPQQVRPASNPTKEPKPTKEPHGPPQDPPGKGPQKP